MLYSIKMRAAENGSHENGGRHISGAERLVSFPYLTAAAAAMVSRAFNHSRGQAEFVNIKIEAIPHQQIVEVPLLPISTAQTECVQEGRNIAVNALVEAGVSRLAAQQGMATLAARPDSMRGATLMCAATGKRLDNTAERGIRVSRMDIADESAFTAWLENSRLSNIHVREALVLASKVASAPGVTAELCWSDDPDYTTGYVGSKARYMRIPHLKPFGSPVGGRVFFIIPGTQINDLIAYLEEQPVLVNALSGGDSCGVCG